MREKRQRQPEKAKVIKKYKHESRHKHAVRRKRCKNGRFVSKSGNDGSDDKSNAAGGKGSEEAGVEGGDVSGSLDKVEIQKSDYKVVD